MSGRPSRTARAVRALAVSVGLLGFVWAGNLVFMSRNDAARGWFDCRDCSTTQNVAGGIFVGGGLLLAILVVALFIAAATGLLRRQG